MSTPPLPSWYQLTTEATFARLEAGPQGLTTEAAARRLERFGPNALTFKRPSALMRLLRQFHNPLVYILLAAALTTGVLSLHNEEMVVDTLVILGVVLLNTLLGFFQEGRAENALLALKNMIVPQCTVVRDGKQHTIPTRELVPGDVVVLFGGDKVPADLRLFSTRECAADESVLTGESIPVEKHTDPIPTPGLPPGDRTCMAFSGTFLARGAALGVVVETAERTEFGKIATMVKRTGTAVTPLQKKIADFTRTLVVAILAIGVVNFTLGSFAGYTLIYSFLASVSLVVAAIPEMLPMIVTAILALAATTMAHKHALIRRLPAAETLGCTTVICSDKTGTLTRNEMTVTRLYAGGREYQVSGVGYAPHGVFTSGGAVLLPDAFAPPLRHTLAVGALCNNAALTTREGHPAIIGDPTEGALLVAAHKGAVIPTLERLDERPFDSDTMYMATLHRGEGYTLLAVKGSPEHVLALCGSQLGGDGESQPLDHGAISAKAEGMAHEALRVLAMAWKRLPPEQAAISDADLSGLEFLGLQGMLDPAREEAIVAVEQCRRAGIRTVMITGDHVLTAKAIAHRLGIIHDHGEEAITGVELSRMDDGELARVVGRVSVYARVAPEHKLRIARQLQARGQVVAMTGDGVNDAPALKAADIGVAMGITGTEVSKEAADMVLTDDNFASIVRAVEEGRHAWNNLEKAILYTLPTNGGQALLVMGAVLLAPFVPLFSARLPLEPVQILWVNLLDSVFLTMPLMMEPKNHDILTTPPREAGVKIADALFLQRVLMMGLAIAVPGFLVYHHFGAAAVVGGRVVDELLLTQAQTAAFWAVLLVHFGFVMSARSVHDSAFTFSPFSNPWLLLGIVVSILVRLVPTFVPEVGTLFRTAEFPSAWWPQILPCLLPGFVMLELDKLLRKRWGSHQPGV